MWNRNRCNFADARPFTNADEPCAPVASLVERNNQRLVKRRRVKRARRVAQMMIDRFHAPRWPARHLLYDAQIIQFTAQLTESLI